VSPISVFVALNAATELHVGTLYVHRRRGTESATFSYAGEYLAHPQAYAVDPELPLRSGAHQTRVGAALFGAFTDCAPDRWGRTLVTRREAALARAERRTPRSLGEVDFLLGVRDDLRQGALRFCIDNGPFLAEDQTGAPDLTDLPSLLELADRAETDSADLPDLQRLIRIGSSLGGARPKAHVRHIDGRIAIAKFPSAHRDDWNVMAWEKVAHDLAADAGIDVPQTTLLNLVGRQVLIVDRFDRTATGGRVGYASAMTMLEAGDGDRRSYLDIADVIERTSLTPTADLAQLWRRIVFSILISNTDDHLRNHGFLHRHGDAWQLAPAFDLNPEPGPGRKYLSTAIDRDDDLADLATAFRVADQFRVSPDAARRTLAEVAGAVDTWRTTARRYRLSASEITAMEPAFVALTTAHAHL
jgi:serine/threonine-protein kinase HipA